MTALREEQLTRLLLEIGRSAFPAALAHGVLAAVGSDLVCIDEFLEESASRATLVELARDPASAIRDLASERPWPQWRGEVRSEPLLLEHRRAVAGGIGCGSARQVCTLSAALTRAGGATVMLSLVRLLPADESASPDRAALAKALPLLHALWQAHQRSLGIEAERNALFEALGRRGLGAVTLDRRGAPISINRRATELMRDGSVLGFSPTRLMVADATESARLRAGVAAVLDELQGGRRGVLRSVDLGRTADGAALRVQLCPVAPGLPHEGARLPAIVALLEDPQRDLRPEVRENAARFGLTSVETELVCRLVQGCPLDRAAAEQRISIHTARKYLQQIFGKTQTCRQADLVRLMISGALPPLATLLAGDASRRRAVR